MPPKICRFLLGFSAVLLLAPDARAVVLGEIRSSSRFGELLHAEIELEEEPADRFDASCVKLYRPAQAAADVPWITEARLSFRRENGKGKLYISSDRPLRDPAVQIGVQSSCPGGRVWREYTFLVSPALVHSASAGSELPALPPAPVRLLPTAEPVAVEPGRRRASVNAPSEPPSRTGLSSSAGIDQTGGLRMSTALASTEVTSEFTRDLLRGEYRLLTELNEKADGQLAMAEKLRRLDRETGDLRAAGLRPAAAGATDAPAPLSASPPAAAVAAMASVAPPASPKAGPEAAAPPPTRPDDSGELLLLVGLGGGLLLILALFIRRRAHPAALAATVPSRPMDAPGVVAERDGLLPTQAAAPAVALDDEMAADAAPAPVPEEIPPPPESLEVTPVMELAEIMLSFGRVSGAAQALQEFIEANPKAALQPWIRLLEIYRDSGMRTDFEALASNLNQNFNVEVVHWDHAASGERVEMSLELLPHIRDQIDTFWGKPECLDYLQKLLRDNRDGERTGFTLPVIKEILLLIDLMVAEKAAEK